MKTRVFMCRGVGEEERDRRDWAVWRGPIVFVVRWCWKEVNDLEGVLEGIETRGCHSSSLSMRVYRDRQEKPTLQKSY
jgi:hypothetical protein